MRIKHYSGLPPAIQALNCFKPSPKVRKYHNKPVIEDGERFDSKLEHRCYQWLMGRVYAGEIAWFTRQVNFKLEGGVKYRCDFLAVPKIVGVEVIDATGLMTQVKKNKLKQMKARYGIDVIVWTGK